MATSVARSGTGPKGRLPHPEHHRTQRVGWLRAAVLGANDGIVSTASLIVGVAAADTSRETILTAGCRRAGRRGDVDGRRRVRLGQLAARRRASRPRPGAPGARRRPSQRAQRTDPDLRATRARRPAGRRGGPPADPPRRPRRPRSRRAGDHRRGDRPPVAGGGVIGGGVHRRRAGARCWPRWPARRRHASWSSPPRRSLRWPRWAPSGLASVAPRWVPPPCASPCSVPWRWRSRAAIGAVVGTAVG